MQDRSSGLRELQTLPQGTALSNGPRRGGLHRLLSTRVPLLTCRTQLSNTARAPLLPQDTLLCNRIGFWARSPQLSAATAPVPLPAPLRESYSWHVCTRRSMGGWESPDKKSTLPSIAGPCTQPLAPSFQTGRTDSSPEAWAVPSPDPIRLLKAKPSCLESPTPLPKHAQPLICTE